MVVTLGAGLFVLAVLGFILWLIINAIVTFVCVKLGLVEQGVRNARGELSLLQFRIGPSFLGVQLKRVLLAKKTLDFIASFLVGLYPVDVVEVHVSRCKTTFSYGLRKYLRALCTGGERSGILAPKLIVRCENLQIVLRSNGQDSWNLQKEAVEASIANGNHSLANWLTELMDKKMRQHRSATVPPSSPNKLSRLIDNCINGLDIDVVGFHISWASENFRMSSTHQERLPQQYGISNSGGRGDKEWNMGVKMKHFSLAPSGPPTPETMGVTPRAMHVDEFDAYLDGDNMLSAEPGSSSSSSSGNGRISNPTPLPDGASAILVHSDEAESGNETARAVPPEPVVDGDHNTIVSAGRLTATFLFPDVMSVLISAEKQPQGNGKLLGLWLDQVDGVVIQLEPFQIYSLLTDVLPVLALSGKYTEWYMATRLQWHKDTLACPSGIGGNGNDGAGVPRTEKELQAYAKALGSPEATESDESGSGEHGSSSGRRTKGKTVKRNSAKLKEMDKNMTLVQIMLTRMRARKWEFDRPERVSKWAKFLLDQMDPFQGVSIDELPKIVHNCTAGDTDNSAAGSVGGDMIGADGKENQRVSSVEEATVVGADADDGDALSYESDQEAPSVSSRQSREIELTRAASISLQTVSPEEAGRLEALLYLSAQVSCGLMCRWRRSGFWRLRARHAVSFIFGLVFVLGLIGLRAIWFFGSSQAWRWNRGYTALAARYIF